MSLLLEPVIIGVPQIIDLENYTNNVSYTMNSINLNGKITISDTETENIKLLHIINNTLHYYAKNVILDNNNKCIVVYLMGVPPPPESKRVEKEPYINNKRVKFDIVKYNRIILLNTEFFGYCTDLEDPDEKKERLRDEIRKKKEIIYKNYVNKRNLIKQQKIKEDNKLLMEKAKIYETSIPKDKDMSNTFFGIDDFEQKELNK